MSRLPQHVRVGLRSLRHAPGFAATAIVTLAVGIGLSTAVFTVADALLLRRLPVRDQDRVVVLWGETRDGRFANFPLDVTDAREFARRARALEQVAFFAYEGAWPQVVRDGDHYSSLRRALVTGDYFDVLGARPVLGRALRATDDVYGAAPVVVLSYSAWQQKFGGDPTVLGRQIIMHETGVVHTIVGVMPQGLDYPRGTDFWATIFASAPSDKLALRSFHLIGRLAPGATPANARDELTAYFGRADAPRATRTVRGVVHTLPRVILGDTRPALIVFAFAAALLLLITCINVANLLLVRGLGRAKEIAVRSALGASRAQVVMQLLAENALLAIVGGALGIVVASAAVRTFVAFAPAEVPRLDEIHVNATALAGAVAITGVAMLLFALAPAIMTSRVELQQMLRSGTRQSSGRRSRLATEVLVAGQVALALLVLSAAGLITRSLVKLEGAKMRLESSHLLIGTLALRFDRYDDLEKQLALLEALVPRLEAVPGVRGVSPVVAPPFAQGWAGRPVAEGQSDEQAAANPMLNLELVGAGYFATLGIPVLRGRGFTDADREGAPPVVVLSESAARYFWPRGDAIGKHVVGSEPKRTLTVVGVVPDTRYRDLRDARATIYYPLRQSFFPFAPTNLAIRTSGPPAEMVPAIRRAIDEVVPGVVLATAAPFETLLEAPLARPRLNALLLAVFAGAAVVLAAVGLFGVMATMVRQRTRELGIRMALGATARDLRRMVMRRGLTIASVGSAVGLLGALLANRLLAAMLYEVSPTDGVTLVAAIAILVGVAALASVVPARSSTRIDAVIALRTDA